MTELAKEGMTMVIVTNGRSLARHVADRVIFMDSGSIIEENTPDAFFTSPQIFPAFLTALPAPRIPVAVFTKEREHLHYFLEGKVLEMAGKKEYTDKNQKEKGCFLWLILPKPQKLSMMRKAWGQQRP